MSIKFKKINPALGRALPEPGYATKGAAGIDLVAALERSVIVAPGGKAMIPTGIAVDIPSRDIVGLLFARSGLSTKHGLTLANAVGVIDSDYKGEIFCAMHNNSAHKYEIKPGDRIAQLIFMPILPVDITYTEQLTDSERGDGGFGSSGR